MPKPQSISEQLMYSTFRLVDQKNESTATGFAFRFSVNGNNFPVLITNRHFAERVGDISLLDFSKKQIKQEISMEVHLADDSVFKVNLNVLWYLHSRSDLAFFPLPELENYVLQVTHKNMFSVCLSEEFIPSQQQLNDLSAVEEVLMVGYPNGLYDSKHNLPIFRSGITSTHPAIDYDGMKLALVDMACLPGSSGSPIFVYNEGMYHNKKGSVVIGSRVIFLGVENAMPVRTTLAVFKKAIKSNGEIEYSPTDEYAVQDDLNLGYYIKSSELLEFKTLIQNANAKQ